MSDRIQLLPLLNFHSTIPLRATAQCTGGVISHFILFRITRYLFKLPILGLYPQKFGFTGVDGAEDSAL